MSTRNTKKIIYVICESLILFCLGCLCPQMISNATTTDLHNENVTESKLLDPKVEKERQFMNYVQEMPDAGITKPLYKFMNRIEYDDNIQFMYEYSFMTDAPCVGIETVIWEDTYISTTIEVHTLNKVKTPAEADIITPTSIPTPTSLEKIYKDESLSAKIQHDAVYLANKYNVPVEILLGIAFKETRYTAGVISADNHDYGFCQIRDINHEWLEKEIGRDLNFLNSEYDSMEAACYMLRNLKNKYSTSSWGFVLLCYNGGEDYALNLASKGIWESDYTRDVLSKAYSLGWNE